MQEFREGGNMLGRQVKPSEEAGESLDDGCVEPKEGWARYLVNNQEQILQARKERQEFLAMSSKFEEEVKEVLSRATAVATKAEQPKGRFSITAGNIPLRVLFMPDKFCCRYDENTLFTEADMVKLVSWAKVNPHELTPAQLLLLCRYLTVTSNHVAVDSLSPLVRRLILNGKYTPEREHVEDMLINLGLRKHSYSFSSTTYYGIPTAKGQPQVWNFKFMFTTIESSYRKWEVRKIEALLKLLSECMFEVALQLCHAEIRTLIRSVLLFLLELGHSAHDLVKLVNQQHISAICNRFIIEQLGGDPRLCAIANALCYETVFGLLNFDPEGAPLSLSLLSNVLDGIRSMCININSSNLYEVLLVCENLIVRNLSSTGAVQCAAALSSFEQYGHSQAPAMARLNLLPVRARLEILTKGLNRGLGKPVSVTVDQSIEPPTSSAVELFLQHYLQSLCCHYCDSRAPAAVVLAKTMSFCLENFVLYEQYDVLSNYITEHVALTPQILKFLIYKFNALSEVKHVTVRTLLELHLAYHPPCRPGMARYYLLVLNERVHNFTLREHCIDETFLDLVERYSTVLRTQGDAAVVKLENMAFIFNYMVRILVEDYVASKKESRVSLATQIVWGVGNDTSLNPHCLTVVRMFFDAPPAYKREIGLYLTLLSGIVQKGEVKKQYSFWRMGTNCMVDTFVNHIVTQQMVCDYSQLIEPLPSPLLQCQILQSLIYNHITVTRCVSPTVSNLPTCTEPRHGTTAKPPKRRKSEKIESPICIDSDDEPNIALIDPVPPYQSSMSPLNSGCWLDNHIIDRSILNLITQHDKGESVAFISNTAFSDLSTKTAYHRYFSLLMSISNIDCPLRKDFILVSWRVDGNHWILGVVCVKTKHILILDPLYEDLRPENIPAARMFMKVAAACHMVGGEMFDESQWYVGSYELRKRQPNDFDCGLFSIYHSTLFMDRDLAIFNDFALDCDGQIIDSDVGRNKVYHLVSVPCCRRVGGRQFSPQELSPWCDALDDWKPTLRIVGEPITCSSVWGDIASNGCWGGSHSESIHSTVLGTDEHPSTSQKPTATKRRRKHARTWETRRVRGFECKVSEYKEKTSK